MNGDGPRRPAPTLLCRRCRAVVRSEVMVTTDQTKLVMHTCDGCRTSWWTDPEGRKLRTRRAAGLLRGAAGRPAAHLPAAAGARRLMS